MYRQKNCTGKKIVRAKNCTNKKNCTGKENCTGQENRKYFDRKLQNVRKTNNNIGYIPSVDIKTYFVG